MLLIHREASPQRMGGDPKLVARGIAVGGIAAYSKIGAMLKAGGGAAKLKVAAAAATAAAAAAAAKTATEEKPKQ